MEGKVGRIELSRSPHKCYQSTMDFLTIFGTRPLILFSWSLRLESCGSLHSLESSKLDIHRSGLRAVSGWVNIRQCICVILRDGLSHAKCITWSARVLRRRQAHYSLFQSLCSAGIPITTRVYGYLLRRILTTLHNVLCHARIFAAGIVYELGIFLESANSVT